MDRSLHRLLFVHAHPDDETLATGVAMAAHAQAGHDVHLLTCTLGEEGEIIPAELAHLAAGRENRLGPYRRAELRRAMSHLGVNERVLGEDLRTETGSRYRDSGMAGTASAHHPRAFCNADLGEATELVAAEIRRIDPDVVITYEEYGGYRHPDHIQTHRVTVAAVASLPASQRPRLYAVVTPRSWARQDRAWLLEQDLNQVGRADGAGQRRDWPVPVALPLDDPYPAGVVPDDVPTDAVYATPQVVASRDAALREHATQVRVYGSGIYTLSNDVAARMTTREAYAALDPETGRVAAASEDPAARLPVATAFGGGDASYHRTDAPAHDRSDQLAYDRHPVRRDPAAG